MSAFIPYLISKILGNSSLKRESFKELNFSIVSSKLSFARALRELNLSISSLF